MRQSGVGGANGGDSTDSNDSSDSRDYSDSDYDSRHSNKPDGWVSGFSDTRPHKRDTSLDGYVSEIHKIVS